MSEVKKESKRDEYVAKLKEMGIEVKGLSDEDLLGKVTAELNKVNSRLASTIATSEMEDYKKYSSPVEHKIKDKDLIIRLMKLNVPNFYLHLFLDKDKAKSDKELWKIVNESKINPFTNVKEIFAIQRKFEPKKIKMRRED
jgi:hypothetical protein